MAFKLAALVALLAAGSAVAQPQFATIGEALNGTAELSILKSLVNTTVSEYLGSLVNITIFAPTDTAFGNAFKGLNLTTTEQIEGLTKNETLVENLLSYHVYLNGSIRVSNFTDGQQLVMLNDEILTVSVQNTTAADNSTYIKTTLQTGVSNATVKGKGGVIEAGNATINLINAVLIPESLAYLIPTNITAVPPPAPSSASLYSAAPLALVGGLLMALML